ncbi:hypothetical protein Nepgr_007152 [Nepenthes gracilis]|uniref:Senescence regulator n=1 Tax=Nepenthes gracilis TaxID=150966 RepID=A0AAD3S760_NEPGR|nr:hypothetical protein Nepgr_007152 [Nepenthes gracilis]
MAKGRRLTSSRSERYLGSYARSHGGGSGTDSLEFGEDDVWSTDDSAADREPILGGGSGYDWNSRADLGSNGNVTGRERPRATRRDRQVGGLSLAFEDSTSSRVVHQFHAQENGVTGTPSRQHHMATSAPVNVPEWNKILRVSSVESLNDPDDGFDEHDSGMDPPHEYLARSRKMAATSVFEGVGRTLRGRDLSRLRDAVWSQTGFDG